MRHGFVGARRRTLNAGGAAVCATAAGCAARPGGCRHGPERDFRPLTDHISGTGVIQPGRGDANFARTSEAKLSCHYDHARPASAS